MKYLKRQVAIAWVLTALASVFPAHAQQAKIGEGLNHRFQASFGAYSPLVDSQARLDAADGTLGTKLDFEDDLDLKDRSVLPWLDVRLRFTPRHHVDFTYYDLSRSGARTLQGEIRIEDSTFPVGIDVDSQFNTKIYRLAYGYSFMNNGKREVSILGGVHLELTGENVTECTGGARGLTDGDLARAYKSTVDPRLNYEQAMEIAMRIAGLHK